MEHARRPQRRPAPRGGRAFREAHRRETRRKVYAPREIVVRQGDVGHEMYFVAHGEVEVIAGTSRRVPQRGRHDWRSRWRCERDEPPRFEPSRSRTPRASRPHFHPRREARPGDARDGGAAVARLRVALWNHRRKSAPHRRRNAIRTNAGFDTLGDADAAKREFARVSSASAGFRSRERRRECPSPREIAKHPIATNSGRARLLGAKRNRGPPAPTAAEATMTRRGPDAAIRWANRTQRSFGLAVASGVLRRRGGGVGRRLATRRRPPRTRGGSRGERRWARVRREVRNATATPAAAAAAAQLVLARLDAEDEDGDGGGRTSGGGGIGDAAPPTRGKRRDGGGTGGDRGGNADAPRGAMGMSA